MKCNYKITILIILSFIVAAGSLITSYSMLNKENGVVLQKEDIYNVEYILNNYVTSSESISFNESPIFNDNEIVFTLGLDEVNSFGQIFFDINNIGDYDAIYNGIVVSGLETYEDNISITVNGLQKGDIIEKGISKKNISLKINYDYLLQEDISNISLNNIKVKIDMGKVGD